MNEERTVDLPFAFDKVWDATRATFERAEWSIKKPDKTTGHYEALVKLTLDKLLFNIPFTEKFQVDIVKINENYTRVHAKIRFHQWHWGTTGWHVNSFFTGLQNALSVG